MSLSLVKRLTSQLQAKGYSEEYAKNTARKVLTRAGHMTSDGKLTLQGMARGGMSPEQRAIDRAMKQSPKKHKASDYQYNVQTNKATLKK